MVLEDDDEAAVVARAAAVTTRAQAGAAEAGAAEVGAAGGGAEGAAVASNAGAAVGEEDGGGATAPRGVSFADAAASPPSGGDAASAAGSPAGAGRAGVRGAVSGDAAGDDAGGAAGSARRVRDRAAERRRHAAALEAEFLAVQVRSEEESKFLGGDEEHTHLVKGLDYALLAKVRREAAKAAAAAAAAASAAAPAGAAPAAAVAARPLWAQRVRQLFKAELHPHSVRFAERMQTIARAVESGARLRGGVDVFEPGVMSYQFNATGSVPAPPTIILHATESREKAGGSESTAAGDADGALSDEENPPPQPEAPVLRGWGAARAAGGGRRPRLHFYDYEDEEAVVSGAATHFHAPSLPGASRASESVAAPAKRKFVACAPSERVLDLLRASRARSGAGAGAGPLPLPVAAAAQKTSAAAAEEALDMFADDGKVGTGPGPVATGPGPVHTGSTPVVAEKTASRGAAPEAGVATAAATGGAAERLLRAVEAKAQSIASAERTRLAAQRSSLVGPVAGDLYSECFPETADLVDSDDESKGKNSRRKRRRLKASAAALAAGEAVT